MNPVDKALWYIESHSDVDTSLDDIAGNACVSKYHLLRAFSAATGMSIMRYVRARRLGKAAQRLVAGADSILSVAVDCGYGSHEAFTRAFRDQFGITPEALRAQGNLKDLQVLDAIPTGQGELSDLEPPRFVRDQVLLVAGLVQRYEGVAAGAGVPAQWQRFTRYLGDIPLQQGPETYGVCYNTDDEGGMDYLCSVAVTAFSSLPVEFTRLRLSAQLYVVFTHRQHIATIRSTWNAIWNGWLPRSGHTVSDAPLFERYDQRFDLHTGNGGVELWIPLL